jgi:hypothetical protein
VQQFCDRDELVGANREGLRQLAKQKCYRFENVQIGAIKVVTFAHVRLISFRRCRFPEAKLAI